MLWCPRKDRSAVGDCEGDADGKLVDGVIDGVIVGMAVGLVDGGLESALKMFWSTTSRSARSRSTAPERLRSLWSVVSALRERFAISGSTVWGRISAIASRDRQGGHR